MLYLDYNGSTPVDPRVAELVEEASTCYANPASAQHRAGQEAAETIEKARDQVGRFLKRPPRDVIFTSGASEAATIGIIGALTGTPQRPNIVIGATEHKAIIAAATTAAHFSRGEVRTARVHLSGEVDIDHLDQITDESVGLLIVMAANNETGVINPVTATAEIAKKYGALFFSDATQLAGKADITPVTGHADLFAVSGHKMYGPKGVGALVVDRHVQRRLVPIFGGGGQERGLRGGTQNTPAIAGFGRACEIAELELDTDIRHSAALSTELFGSLQRKIPDIILNGESASKLPNTLNLRFIGADAEAVMASMPNVAVSSGSACQSSVPSQSHVLQAMGLSTTEAAESIRISLGRPTTIDEIEQAANEIIDSVARVRALAA